VASRSRDALRRADGNVEPVALACPCVRAAVPACTAPTAEPAASAWPWPETPALSPSRGIRAVCLTRRMASPAPLVTTAPNDIADVVAFLSLVDLTVSGMDATTLRLWLVRAGSGEVVGTTGYELSDDGRHALIRSVAVHPDHRAAGFGSRLARVALDRAAEEGARTAWLFSRRSGPFWRGLGFAPAERGDLAAALAGTQQVQLFRRTGQLHTEVAWRRALTAS